MEKNTFISFLHTCVKLFIETILRTINGMMDAFDCVLNGMDNAYDFVLCCASLTPYTIIIFLFLFLYNLICISHD